MVHISAWNTSPDGIMSTSRQHLHYLQYLVHQLLAQKQVPRVHMHLSKVAYQHPRTPFHYIAFPSEPAS